MTALPPVDLRSDTLTRPTPAMRQAMLEAEVGDDVFGEDPTVNALQERVAALFGREAALFVPSGTMANQIALKTWCRPGDDVVAGEGSHVWYYEAGAAGALSGVQISLVGDGLLTAAQLQAALKPDNHQYAPTTLAWVENTHNRSGGRILPLAQLQEVQQLCRQRGVHLHMDGARLLNAAVATQIAPAAWGGAVDALSICLSKGLGCPVGSVLVGDRDWIWRAHRFRKMLGGAMRQAGILAAAGLYALEHHVERLAEDHRRAQAFAEAAAALPAVTLGLDTVQTNIVAFAIDPARMSADTFVAQAAARGLLSYAIGPQRVRLVFHLEIDDDGLQRAVDLTRALLS